jgi:hypothetical protein
MLVEKGSSFLSYMWRKFNSYFPLQFTSPQRTRLSVSLTISRVKIVYNVDEDYYLE